MNTFGEVYIYWFNTWKLQIAKAKETDDTTRRLFYSGMAKMAQAEYVMSWALAVNRTKEEK